ncbi:MAG: hypothetical protein RJA36_3954 [Pseudomonadota bacterium]|jgi:HK97 family phage portal protein
MFLAANIGAARGPADDFWFSSVGVGTAAGVPVSSDSAMRLSTVYKCVRVRAETIGMLPLMVYRRLEDGGKERATDHWAYRLLHDQPNPWMTAMGLRSMMQAHLDLRGNAYAQIVTDGAGRVDMLLPLHPDRMQVEVTPGGAPRYIYTQADGTRRTYVFGELLHVASLSLDGYQGMNPIEAEREAIGAAIAARDYGARYFANSARPPMWIKMAGKFASPEDRRKYASDFAAGFGGMNSGRVPVMEDGKELHAIQINNSDAQFLELRKYSDVDIAGLFRMPPHKIGILDRATWGNIEHQQLDFSTDTIMPSCIAWEQALLRDLGIGDDGIHFAEHKLDVLLRGDTRTRFEAYGKGIQDGWLTRNEARSMENLNPLPGLNAPLQPMNMQPVGAAPAQLPEPPPISGERRVALLQAAAERVARKELALCRKGGAFSASEHGRWISEVLGVPENVATAYADALPGIFAARNAEQISDPEFLAARSAALIQLGA